MVVLLMLLLLVVIMLPVAAPREAVLAGATAAALSCTIVGTSGASAALTGAVWETLICG